MYIDLARVLGSDPTWGFSNVVADALGCTPVDLATPDELLLDPPPAQRCVHVRSSVRSAPFWRSRTHLVYAHLYTRSEAALRQRLQGLVPAIEQMQAAPFFQQFDVVAVAVGGGAGRKGSPCAVWRAACCMPRWLLLPVGPWLAQWVAAATVLYGAAVVLACVPWGRACMHAVGACVHARALRACACGVGRGTMHGHAACVPRVCSPTFLASLTFGRIHVCMHTCHTVNPHPLLSRAPTATEPPHGRLGEQGALVVLDAVRGAVDVLEARVQLFLCIYVCVYMLCVRSGVGRRWAATCMHVHTQYRSPTHTHKFTHHVKLKRTTRTAFPQLSQRGLPRSLSPSSSLPAADASATSPAARTAAACSACCASRAFSCCFLALARFFFSLALFLSVCVRVWDLGLEG